MKSSADSILERLSETAEAIERSSRRAGRAGSRIVDSAASDAEAVMSREWAALRRDLADLAGNIDLAAMPEVGRLIDQMKASIASASAAVGETAAGIGRRATESAETIDAKVHDAPWQTAGVAALAGVAIGIMIGRR